MTRAKQKQGKFGGVVQARSVAEASGNQVPENTGTPKLGRPAGKRSDTNYRQVSAWVRKSTYDEATIQLVKMGRIEFSEAVENLLRLWLDGRVIVEKDRARVAE